MEGRSILFWYSKGSKKYNGKLPLGGMHNVKNALAAIAAAEKHDVSIEDAVKALATFPGGQAPFSGYSRGVDWTYIDDYAHHPSEISALIQGLRSMQPSWPVTVIFQPHLYSRTQALADQFAEALSAADQVILLPIYPAREEPIAGVESELIARNVNVPLPYFIAFKRGSVVSSRHIGQRIFVSAGAGDISSLIPAIQKQLERIYG